MAKSKSKLPFMQWYVQDWLSDPQVTKCKPATRGVWFDWLCRMWLDGQTGELAGDLAQLARLGRCSEEEAAEAIIDAVAHDIADVTISDPDADQSGGVIQANPENSRALLLRYGSVTRNADVTPTVTLTNRRMVRDRKTRKSNAERQKRHRKQKDADASQENNGSRNGRITPDTSYVKRHTSELRESKAPPTGAPLGDGPPAEGSPAGRSDGAKIRLDGGKLEPWEVDQIKARCNDITRMIGRTQTDGDRSLIIKVAMLEHAGELSSDDVVQTVEAVNVNKPTKPFAYLHRALANRLDDGQFNALLSGVRAVPSLMQRKPRQ